MVYSAAIFGIERSERRPIGVPLADSGHPGEVDVTKSFKRALAAYATTSHPADGACSPPRLSAADRAHLKRWADDERADEVWNTIKGAANKRGRIIPERYFIQEVLGAREIATSINHRRKHRERYRTHATRMVEITKVLQTSVYLRAMMRWRIPNLNRNLRGAIPIHLEERKGGPND
jgi:hypothetical protein